MIIRLIPIIQRITALFFFIALTVTGSSDFVNASIPQASSGQSLLNLDLRVFVAGKPINLILVEKDKQTLKVLRHDGRLELLAEYKAATGEQPGPKEKEGDSRTPEGIYFITKIYTDTKITIFGKRAFHLDYPNIFDRDAGRDGNGIFVHGTNKALISNSTNGCVTLNNQDLEKLVRYLPIGTVPVIVVSSLTDLETDNSNDARVMHFASENFLQAKTLLLPAEMPPHQVFFNNLYMISTNKQTIAVGEYNFFETPNSSRKGFVRGYLYYTDDSGWSVADLFQQDSPTEKSLYKSNKYANLITAPKSASTKKANNTDSIFPQTTIATFIPDKGDLYLSWYQQANKTKYNPLQNPKSAPPVRVPPKKAEQPVTVSIATTFLFSFCLSLALLWGAVFVLTKKHIRQNQHFRKEEEKKNKGFISQINEDISDINRLITTLRKHSPYEINQANQKLQAQITEFENQLLDKQNEIHTITRSATKLRKENSRYQKETENFDKKVDSLTQEIKEKQALFNTAEEQLAGYKTKLDTLTFELSRTNDLERELSSSQAEINRLTTENRLLVEAEKQDKTYQDELMALRSSLETVEQELQNASAQRSTLELEIERLKTAEEKLQKRQDEIDLLTAKNLELAKQAKQLEYKEELEQLRTHLETLEKELSEASIQRDRQEYEIARLTEIEKELLPLQEEIKILTAKNNELRQLAEPKAPQESKPDPQEEVLQQARKPPTHPSHSPVIPAAQSLPIDVLQQWIGK